MPRGFQSVGVAQVVAAGLLGFVSCVIAADLIALLFAAGACGLMGAAGVGLLRGDDPGRAGKLVAAVLLWLGLWAAYAAALVLARQRPSAAGVMTSLSSALTLGLIAVLAAAQAAAFVYLWRDGRRAASSARTTRPRTPNGQQARTGRGGP